MSTKWNSKLLTFNFSSSNSSLQKNLNFSLNQLAGLVDRLQCPFVSVFVRHYVPPLLSIAQVNHFFSREGQTIVY